MCVDKSNKQTMNGRGQHTLYTLSENVLVSSKPRRKRRFPTQKKIRMRKKDRDREEALEKLFPQRQRLERRKSEIFSMYVKLDKRRGRRLLLHYYEDSLEPDAHGYEENGDNGIIFH